MKYSLSYQEEFQQHQQAVLDGIGLRHLSKNTRQLLF